jgi:hypothetical protein
VLGMMPPLIMALPPEMRRRIIGRAQFAVMRPLP